MTPTPSAASTIHAVFHPHMSMNICVRGTKTIAPSGMPSAMYDIALPRSRTNHLSTGTEVTSAPGPLKPTSPIIPNRATIIHASFASFINASPTIAQPVTMTATGSIMREP